MWLLANALPAVHICVIVYKKARQGTHIMRNWIGSTAMGLGLCFAPAPLLAQDKPKEAEKAAPAIDAPVVSVTKHSGTFGGTRVNYTATASDTFLKDDKGTPRARIFSVSYVKDAPETDRPVTFLFNGGPGSGSL